MKYVCLVYFEGKALAALSKDEHDALDRACLAYNDELEKSRHLLHVQALQSPENAVTVRVRNGKISSIDGPFAETKEQLGGFILIEARDLNEAIQIAVQSPLAPLGSLEVRPIQQRSEGV